ncbi:MAG: excinuclease ABC subunit UvrA [Candidatus Paceibacteria bacterium]
MKEKITIEGAREHNLKDIDLELPRNNMIVFTGLSGSGKTSLAFDTIFAEGQRRYVESLSPYARQFLGSMQKPDVEEIKGLSPGISINQKTRSANPRSTVATITDVYDYLRVLFARIGTPYSPEKGEKLEKMTTDQITETIIDEIGGSGDLIILAPLIRGRKGEYYQLMYDLYNDGYLEARVDNEIRSLRDKIVLDKNKKHTIEVVVDRISIDEKKDIEENLERIAEAVETAVDLADGSCITIYPNKQEETYSTEYVLPEEGTAFPEIEPRLFSFNSPYGYCKSCEGLGVKSKSSEEVCSSCIGKRLNEYALSVKIKGKNIYEVTTMHIGEASEFFEGIEDGLSDREKEISQAALRETRNRLKFMDDVGLHYLTLDRKAGTLSGGESQRIRLASQVGQQLVGAMYVLDEPTIGLHQRDNKNLVKTLRNLCDDGNTIITVEHDQETIMSSDWVVDLGPKAGKHGGEIVYSGPLEQLLDPDSESDNYDCDVLGEPEESLTGKYLRGEKEIENKTDRLKVDDSTNKITIKGAKENNLKNIDVDIPLRRFVALTGVSGSGKSTLMEDILYRASSNQLHNASHQEGRFDEIEGLDHVSKVKFIDQSGIGRTPRSCPATYTKAFDYIRDLYASMTEAKVRGYDKGRFSFNKKEGRCENCRGRGQIKIEMHFLPSVKVTCDVCGGARYNKETRQVHYKGKSIDEVLDMTIEEAEQFFKDIPKINDRLSILNDVGLDYLTLGQPAPTLSGGEAQRVKLAKELAKRRTTNALYLLDEPTTGLHYEDVRKLIRVLQQLVAKGNTVMVIEHNLELIKCADWIIDLGPEGGEKGGELVKAGTPERIASFEPSYTGNYLRKHL